MTSRSDTQGRPVVCCAVCGGENCDGHDGFDPLLADYIPAVVDTEFPDELPFDVEDALAATRERREVGR